MSSSRLLAVCVATALLVLGCGQGNASKTTSDPVTAAVDELIAAWNTHDVDAVQAVLASDFSTRSPSGVEHSGPDVMDFLADSIESLTAERIGEGTPNDDGTVTFKVEFTNPDSRYPTAYTWQVGMTGDRISRIDERRATE